MIEKKKGLEIIHGDGSDDSTVFVGGDVVVQRVAETLRNLDARIRELERRLKQGPLLLDFKPEELGVETETIIARLVADPKTGKPIAVRLKDNEREQR